MDAQEKLDPRLAALRAISALQVLIWVTPAGDAIAEAILEAAEAEIEARRSRRPDQDQAA